MSAQSTESPLPHYHMILALTEHEISDPILVCHPGSRPDLSAGPYFFAVGWTI